VCFPKLLLIPVHFITLELFSIASTGGECKNLVLVSSFLKRKFKRESLEYLSIVQQKLKSCLFEDYSIVGEKLTKILMKGFERLSDQNLIHLRWRSWVKQTYVVA